MRKDCTFIMEKTHVSGRSIEKELFIKAAPERVFQALIEKEYLERWFMKTARVDLRPGGALRFDWWPGLFAEGKILVLDPPKRLSYIWEAILPGDGADAEALSPGDTTLTFELTPENAGTRLHFTHTGIGDGEEWNHYYETRKGGWDVHLNNLTTWLETGKETNW